MALRSRSSNRSLRLQSWESISTVLFKMHHACLQDKEKVALPKLLLFKYSERGTCLVVQSEVHCLLVTSHSFHHFFTLD